MPILPHAAPGHGVNVLDIGTYEQKQNLLQPLLLAAGRRGRGTTLLGHPLVAGCPGQVNKHPLFCYVQPWGR